MLSAKCPLQNQQAMLRPIQASHLFSDEELSLLSSYVGLPDGWRNGGTSKVCVRGSREWGAISLTGIGIDSGVSLVALAWRIGAPTPLTVIMKSFNYISAP